MTDKPTSAPEPAPASPTNAEASAKVSRSSQARSLLSSVWSAVAMPLLAIVLALVVGGIVIILTSALEPDKGVDWGLPFRAYQALWDGSLGSPNGRVNVLVFASPLILAGLGVGLGFKAGLFNIGGDGQFKMGALAAVAAAVAVKDQPSVIAIPIAVLAGAAAGAFWGFIPGALKAFRGAHEVVTTIMLNFVALYFISWVISAR
jgi:simple sugar transport system permease protein